MYRNPDTTNTFSYKPEDGINPYIGFMSFQHFRGEKLYSDCVVRPENKLTETERFECYPVSSDAAENGRNEGYYPDTSVVYIRALWKEFEPRRGEYNYDFFEKLLDRAKAHGQTLIFRLMAHSTRERDDVPQWLKSIIDCPERPDGKRVKDSPTDPLFLELFCNAVRKLGERFDTNPYFEAIDISFPGAWGEGHNLHLYSDESLERLVDTYLDVFKNTQLVVQLAKPELIHRANKTTTAGWRGDGLGHPEHTQEIYPPSIEEVKDVWKTAPVSFESYWWLGEWKRKGWSIDDIIQKTLEWHISSFNAKSLPIPYEWRDKVDMWVRKMGYHFAIDSFSYPEKASAGDELSFEMCINNVGVAPIYKKVPLYIRLSGGGGEHVFITDIDARHWLPGKSIEKFSITLGDIPKGRYSLEVGMKTVTEQTVFFCCDAERSGEYYKVGEVIINDE